MIFTKFSSKQMQVFNWWLKYDNYDAIIADGSIRSGKTISMSISFVIWAMNKYSRHTFAICGKTIESLRRNVIVPLLDGISSIYSIRENHAQNYIEISDGKLTNRFYLFGGRDESSYKLIQGITLAGVMFDEVALMPRSFVEQAIARCSIEGSKFWFNCNPEGPSHWFYTEWIEKSEEKRALYLHFNMRDNLSLSDEIRQRYERMYSGVFYERYIKGKWIVAEGLIYTMFNPSYHVVTSALRDYERYYISCDYGTLNPFAAHLWGLFEDKWYCIKEYYYDGRKLQKQKTDEEYYYEIENLAQNKRIEMIIVDPSAASFITCIRKHGKYNVVGANNDVLDGIRNVSTMLVNKNIYICSDCTATIREFEEYAWDDKSASVGIDKPLKVNDHTMDSIRYFVNTVVMRDTSPGFINVGIWG